MGASGSSHIKVLGDCYDLNEGKEYSGLDNIGVGLFAVCSLVVTCVLLAANFFTKFENGILIGLTIFFGLCTLYGFTIGPIVSKYMFARKNGTRVPCPAPVSECDEDYKRYVSEGRSWAYTCDDRVKYN